jgi:hypothetical protein
MPDDDLFRRRAGVRLILSVRTDAELSLLFEASLQEVVHRAGQAWEAVKCHNGPRRAGRMPEKGDDLHEAVRQYPHRSRGRVEPPAALVASLAE